ncbi:Ger(x)C family spore germination protein [Sporosarcina sp. GW1-11]|uniref:Ger(x)C family spore germination protein n=1 Tax=Sporosarcina sp. GW1-11 TaxID=2899126 RepID=UPI00294FA125|nr:Ger(x)C family spore germination protein [Sporosarcina sp. GW1-11]MDV6377311.1 Ger(x)C family spore germination protein [Sporosarcina sp. GW1-11]
MNKRILVMIVLLLTFLSGCLDMNEPERMLYVNGIGIDFKDGKYELYTQFVNFSNTAKSEQPIDVEAVQAEIGHATGETMDEAIFELYHSVDQKIYWGLMTYIVVSEEVMVNRKLSPVIDAFIRFKETRYQIWVYATKDSVQDVLLIRPVLNASLTLSKLSDPKNSFKQESFIEPVDFRRVIVGLNEPSHEVNIPLVSVEENWQSLNGTIKAPVLSGVGVVTPTSFKGFISGDKALGIQWMSSKMKRGQVTFKLDGGNYFTMIIDHVEVKIKPIVQKGEVKFDIDVQLETSVSSIGGKITKAQIRKEIKKVIKNDIQATYQEALEKDIDIYNFSNVLYRKNVKEWKKYHKDGELDLTEDSIRNLKVTITNLTSERKSYEETIKP